MAKLPPIEGVDPNMRSLVRALNRFQGITTVGSCGGHPEPTNDQWPEGQWYVKLRVDHTEHGWHALEFLAWLINVDARKHHIVLYPTSPPPYLNEPGACLLFALQGVDEDPEELGNWIERLAKECYIPPRAQAVIDYDV
jgi:hypothetical protein